MKEYTPWQVDQHKFVERYIQLLPENILAEYPYINLFSRHKFDYSRMSLDFYYGIPDEIIARYGSIESNTVDLEFFFKKRFSNRTFTMLDVQIEYNRYVYLMGGWYEYDELKQFIFKSLEGDNPLLKQTFIEEERCVKLEVI